MAPPVSAVISKAEDNSIRKRSHLRMEKKIFRAAAWLLALIVGTIFLSQMQRVPPQDFAQFYLTGKLVTSGQISRLYQPAAYEPFAAEIRAIEGYVVVWHYFNRPAFAAVLYTPLSWLPYRQAMLLYVLLNLILLAYLVWRLPQWFPALLPFRPWLFAFAPLMWTVAFCQDTILLTLLFTYGVHLIRQDRQAQGGALLALCTVKPHLIWAVPLALLFGKKRKALCFFLTVAAILGLASFALVGPAGFGDWINLLQADTTDVLPEHMANIRAIALRFGKIPGLILGILNVLCFGWILWRGSFEEKLCASVMISLLLSPHTYMQDLSLLLIVAALDPSAIGRYFLLLPWPYFAPEKSRRLALVYVALGYLVLIAARPAIRGLYHRQSRTANVTPPQVH